MRSHDVARRLITFVDEAYDAQIRLLWTAADSPQCIFNDAALRVPDEEGDSPSTALDKDNFASSDSRTWQSSWNIPTQKHEVENNLNASHTSTNSVSSKC